MENLKYTKYGKQTYYSSKAVSSLTSFCENSDIYYLKWNRYVKNTPPKSPKLHFPKPLSSNALKVDSSAVLPLPEKIHCLHSYNSLHIEQSKTSPPSYTNLLIQRFSNNNAFCLWFKNFFLLFSRIQSADFTEVAHKPILRKHGCKVKSSDIGEFPDLHCSQSSALTSKLQA